MLELEKLGRSLYGDYWQAELAKKVKVNRSTVGRWRRGISKTPESVLTTLRMLEKDHGNNK